MYGVTCRALTVLELTASCSGVHESRLMDLTLDMCTPRLRCMPAHLIHRNTPKFHDAQRGPEKRKITHCKLAVLQEIRHMTPRTFIYSA